MNAIPIYLAAAMLLWASIATAENTNCSTDYLGTTLCSDGTTYSTDAFGMTHDNLGNSWSTDTLGTT